MKIIEQIASEAHLFLQPGGWLFLEIGADQKKAVSTLFRLLARQYSEVRVVDDWAGRPRVVQARHVPR
jgi:release factor glutamine methyltransferase